MPKEKTLTQGTTFPTAAVLLTCLGRSWLVGAGMSLHGMQSLGLAFAMNPGLMAIYSNAQALTKARKRYSIHFNTHPLFVPALVGIFLNMENNMAKGILPVDTVENIRSTTISSLSAIGDSFFGGSLFCLWSLSTACLLLLEAHLAAVLLCLATLFCFFLFKVGTFWLGFKEGLHFLSRLKRWNMVNCGRVIKTFNALLLLLFLLLSWPGTLSLESWLLFMSVFLLAGRLIWQLKISREVLFLLALGIYFIFAYYFK